MSKDNGMSKDNEMRALWYERNGAAGEVLQAGRMDIPKPGRGEVLVRLHASGVNPSDVKARAGSRPMGFARVVPHSDGAGIIEAVGDGVDGSLTGGRVFVRNGQWQRAEGTAAEYIAIDEGCVHKLPERAGFDVGACLGIPALTAACAVLRDGPVDGETVLVHGGGGTVARLAVQIARDAGATVIATTGAPDDARHILDAGASHVLDYRSGDLASDVAGLAGAHPVQRIIDCECATNIESSIEILAPGGVIVGYGSALKPVAELPFMPMMFKNITLSAILVYLLSADEAAAYADIVCDMIERDVLDVPIAGRFKLEDAAAAHEAVETGGRRGAVILEM